MPIASITDVADRLGRPVAPEETARVSAFLADVTALVEDYCGKDLERRQEQTLEVPAAGGCVVTIPPRYQVQLSVTSVQLDGQALTGWYLDGRNLVLDLGWPVGTLTMTASWGYLAIPASLRAVTCSEVIRWLSISPGTVRERTGDLEVEYAATEHSQGLSEGARSMLAKYRPRVASISLKREASWR
jgi:hypothetical protein